MKLKKTMKRITLATASLAFITTSIGTFISNTKVSAQKTRNLNYKSQADSYQTIIDGKKFIHHNFVFGNDSTRILWNIVENSKNQKDAGWAIMHWIASGVGWKYGSNFRSSLKYSKYVYKDDDQYNSVCNFLQGILPHNHFYKWGFIYSKFINDLKQSTHDNKGLSFNIISYEETFKIDAPNLYLWEITEDEI